LLLCNIKGKTENKKRKQINTWLSVTWVGPIAPSLRSGSGIARQEAPQRATAELDSACMELVETISTKINKHMYMRSSAQNKPDKKTENLMIHTPLTNVANSSCTIAGVSNSHTRAKTTPGNRSDKPHGPTFPSLSLLSFSLNIRQSINLY